MNTRDISFAGEAISPKTTSCPPFVPRGLAMKRVKGSKIAADGGVFAFSPSATSGGAYAEQRAKSLCVWLSDTAGSAVFMRKETADRAQGPCRPQPAKFQRQRLFGPMGTRTGKFPRPSPGLCLLRRNGIGGGSQDTASRGSRAFLAEVELAAALSKMSFQHQATDGTAQHHEVT